MWLIGLDDTDVPDSRGTGHLARMLAHALAGRGLMACGVTRHQLLVHPSVPYTSHNSASCLAVESDGEEPSALFAFACELVAAHSPWGSDPGVCLARAEGVGERVIGFGQRAQREFVLRQEAEAVARLERCFLAGLAGTRDGVIGALAAIGLRAGGADGRFIALGRIRELDGRVRVRDLLAAGVDAVSAPGLLRPRDGEWVETFGWVRPRLIGGRAVLLVERSEEDGADWIVTDRRRAGSGRALRPARWSFG